MRGSVYRRYSKKEGCWLYIGRIYRNGKRYSTKPYKTKSEAKEAASRLLTNIKERKVVDEKISFTIFADEFLEHAKLVNQNYMSHVYRLRHLKPFLKGKKLDQITRADIHKYINQRLKLGRAKATVNRELACLKRILNYALEVGKLAVNPMTRFPMLREEERAVRSLTPEEEKQLVDFCKASGHPVYTVFADMIGMVVHTGMRLSEILDLKWEQIDLESGTIMLGKTKAKKVRLLPINSVVNEVLIRLNQKSYDEYVFPLDRSGTFDDMKDRVKFHWREMRKKVGIKVRFHDLRATFATRLDKKGASAFTIKVLMGHSTMDVTKRYIGVDDSVRRAVDSLAHDEIGAKIGSNSDSKIAKNQQIM